MRELPLGRAIPERDAGGMPEDSHALMRTPCQPKQRRLR